METEDGRRKEGAGDGEEEERRRRRRRRGRVQRRWRGDGAERRGKRG